MQQEVLPAASNRRLRDHFTYQGKMQRAPDELGDAVIPTTYGGIDQFGTCDRPTWFSTGKSQSSQNR